MSLAGGTTNETTLLAFGVKSNAAIDQGEVWRFITPIFIHIGLLHLFFNSYALWIVGPQVEKLYGSERFAVLYLLTGVAGVFGSYFYHPQANSAGASGAIFGLFGVLLVFGIRYRHSIPPFFKRAVGTGVLPVIAINLFIGFTIPGIDNSAHISGLVAGAVLAALVPYLRPGGQTHRFFAAVQILLLMVAGMSFYEVAVNYNGPRFSFRNLGTLATIMPTGSPLDDFAGAINTAQEGFRISEQQIESGRAGGLAESRSKVSESIDKLRKISSPDARSGTLSAELLKLMQDQYELIQDIERAHTITFAHDRRLKENSGRYSSIMKSFDEWVDTEGKRYGLGR